MKTRLLLLLLTCSVAASAQEIADTIILKSGKTVVVTENKDDVNVTITDSIGDTFDQVYEKKTSDDREIEYYISSPFFPTSKEVKRKKKIINMYPGIFLGKPSLCDGAFGGKPDYTRDSKSWEWGITFATFQGAISKEHALGLTGALQLTNVHQHFSKSHVLSCDPDGVYSFTASPDDTRKSYMSYWALHMPIMLETQSHWGKSRVNLAIGLYAEWRFKAASRYYVQKGKVTENNDLDINPLGLGIEARAGLSGIQFYCRMALTPIINTKNTPTLPKAFYPVSLGIGF